MCKFTEFNVGETKTIEAALIKKITEKKTKNNKAYCVFTLTDGEDDVSVTLWDKRAIDIPMAVNTCISAEIKCEEYNGNKTYTIVSYKKSDAGPEQFIKKAPGKPEKMFNYIMSQVRTMPEDLRDVTEYILTYHMEKLLYYPGAMMVHHSYASGLLYHITKMLYASIPIIKTYGVDENLVKAGIILHDIGKLRELELDEAGNAKYSVEGNLFGHTALGMLMVEEACTACEVEHTENIDLLLSIIASHHQQPDHGAVTLPQTKEAYVVSILDLLDSKLDIFDTALEDIEPGTCGERQKYLDGAHPYRRKEKETMENTEKIAS